MLSNAGFQRKNFQTTLVGDFEVRKLKVYGLNTITILPINDADIIKLQSAISVESIIHNGYIVIK
jgi:hypothetical protein